MASINYGIDFEAAKRSREHATKRLKPKRILFLLQRIARLQGKLQNIPASKPRPLYLVNCRIRDDLGELLNEPRDTIQSAIAKLQSEGRLPKGFTLAR